MSRTLLTSLRMERDNVKAIAEICDRHRYWNRSRVVNAILTAALFCCDKDGLFRILESYDPVGDGVEIYVRSRKPRTIL